MIPFLNGRGRWGFFVHYDSFFLLSGTVIRIFCSNECLTTLRVVISMAYSCSSSERSPAFLKGLPRKEGQCPNDIYPSHMGMYTWV